LRTIKQFAASDFESPSLRADSTDIRSSTRWCNFGRECRNPEPRLFFAKAQHEEKELGAILFACRLALAPYPAAWPGFNWQSVGVPPGWTHHYTGFMAHWNKNPNLGNAFD
jgi:hypothetical protein